jgi:hypothetical protein
MDKLKSLLGAAVFFIVLAILCVILWDEYNDVVELSSYGARAVGTVVHYDLNQRRGRRGRTRYEYDHTIVYAGHKRIFERGQEYPVGSQFYVLYSTRNPDIARITTTAEQSASALLVEELGWGGILFGSGFILFVAFGGVACTMHVLGFGSEDDEKT